MPDYIATNEAISHNAKRWLKLEKPVPKEDLNQIRWNRPRLPYISPGQFTIQGIPNWSTHMPKPFEKKVLAKGM